MKQKKKKSRLTKQEIYIKSALLKAQRKHPADIKKQAELLDIAFKKANKMGKTEEERIHYFAEEVKDL